MVLFLPAILVLVLFNPKEVPCQTDIEINGLAYKILADFGDGNPVSAGEVTLRSGESVTLDCASFLFRCRRK